VQVEILLNLHVYFIVKTTRRGRSEPYKLHVEQIRTARMHATSFRCLWRIPALPAKELAHMCSIPVRSACDLYGSNRLKQAVRTMYLVCGADEFSVRACAFLCEQCVLTWTRALKGVGACGRTLVSIYTKASEGPNVQASGLVNALRAERTNEG
jgi:hypothetical protein